MIMRNDIKLAKQIMDSALPPACFETLNILENFIHGQSENKEKLLNWLHWLSNRRIHWAKTFKCDLITPSSNLLKQSMPAMLREEVATYL